MMKYEPERLIEWIRITVSDLLHALGKVQCASSPLMKTLRKILEEIEVWEHSEK